jgi:hypothetical protein
MDDIDTEEHVLNLAACASIIDEMESQKKTVEFAVTQPQNMRKSEMESSNNVEKRHSCNPEELDLALQESVRLYHSEREKEVRRSEIEEKYLHQIEILSSITADREKKYTSELELAIQESQLVEASRLEAEELLRELEEDMIAELLVRTRISDK